jgi:protein disulfide-isomerase A1
MMKIACLFLAVCVVAAYDKDGDVLVLHDSDIADAIAENEFILIEFYAPWCGHCKSLAPEYAKAATKLAALDTPIPIAKVDATEETESASKYGVRGYPTLKWFVNGVESEYNGGRTDAEIVTWIKKKTGPPCKSLADKDAVEAFKSGADVVVVGFMATDGDDFKALEGAARASDDIEFGIADASLAADFDVTAPAVVLFKNFDEGVNVFDGEMNAEALGTFVAGNSVPLISTFSQESASKIFGSGIDTHFLYFNDASSDSHEAVMGAMKEVAVDFKGKTLFVFVPASEDRVLSYFDFSTSDLPKAILVNMGEGDMKKYAFDADLTADNIRSHVQKYHDGSLTPTLKSEDAPADNSGPVTVIVGTNFEELVMDDSKDVLLEFYAPWCGHCKSLAPVYEELGEKFQSNSNIVIAKIDATANDIDHPAVSVKGFPTIIFFPAGSKDSPKTYEGGRDLESLVAYVEENSKSAPASDDGPAHSEL